MQDEHETTTLIGANKVEGTKVFNVSGEELGQIHEIMINKLTGNVAYAIMSFGGLFGMGEKYAPLPWPSLTYDTELGGYISDLDKEKLKNAPEYRMEQPVWSRAYEDRIKTYYAM